MNMNFELKELKRNLDIRKVRFVDEMKYLINVFDIDNVKYEKKFNELCDEMMKIGIKYFEMKRELDNCDLKCEKLKKSILNKENIDIESKIEKLNRNEKNNIVNRLFELGFLNNNECEILLKSNWDKRYKLKFSD